VSFTDTVTRAWREHSLFSVLIELTYRCNLSCFYCYNDLGLRGRPLSLEDHLRLLADLRRLEVLNLVLSGGEPLAYPHFLTLGAEARRLGFAIRIKSNGHALRGALARRIRDRVDPFVIDISLHGACAESHDRQTRVAGSFTRLLANLEEMRGLGLRVKLNCTLTCWNEAEIEAMVRLARRLALPLAINTEVTRRDDGDPAPLAIAASRQGLANLFERQMQAPNTAPARRGIDRDVGRGDDLQPASSDKHCGAGSATLAIDPVGNVYPCVQWRRALGNLHQQSIVEIWQQAPGLAEVRSENRAVRRMLAARPDGRQLAFCPGSARLATGSSLRLHDAARRRAEVWSATARQRSRPRLPVVRGEQPVPNRSADEARS